MLRWHPLISNQERTTTSTGSLWAWLMMKDWFVSIADRTRRLRSSIRSKRTHAIASTVLRMTNVNMGLHVTKDSTPVWHQSSQSNKHWWSLLPGYDALLRHQAWCFRGLTRASKTGLSAWPRHSSQMPDFLMVKSWWRQCHTWGEFAFQNTKFGRSSRATGKINFSSCVLIFATLLLRRNSRVPTVQGLWQCLVQRLLGE